MIIQLQKKNGCIIEFECDLSDAEARQIVIEADRANQNVGAFALKLATQRRGLSESQSGWLRYLAMEISGRLRPQILAGPWAWLLSQPTYETDQIRITTPPSINVDPGRTAQVDPVCRWVFVKQSSEASVDTTPFNLTTDQTRVIGGTAYPFRVIIDGAGATFESSFTASVGSPSCKWQYVGLIDSNGGFYFSKHLAALISGEGRQSMALMFPEEEQQQSDAAKWLQWQTHQLLETLRRP